MQSLFCSRNYPVYWHFLIFLTVALLLAGCRQPAPRGAVPPPTPVVEKVTSPTAETVEQPKVPAPEILPIPPKEQWKVTASAVQEDIFPATAACDGDYGTRWSSPASDPHWLQIDLGRPATISGMTILWETAFSSRYQVQISDDTEDWRTVFENRHGDGHTDEIFFEPVTARYIRILGLKRGTGWGYSIFEVKLKGADEQVLVSTDGMEQPEPSPLFDGILTASWQTVRSAPCQLWIDLRRPYEFGGLRIEWGANYATEAEMQISMDNVEWQTVAEITEGTGNFDVLLHPRKKARYIRLAVDEAARDDSLALREIMLRGPDEDMSPLALYQLAAEKAPAGLYPDILRNHQVYWTLVGLPADTEESLLDEYGSLEPQAGSCTLMPYIEDNGTLFSAMDAGEVQQSLVDDFLPLPAVQWQLNALQLDIEAFARGTPADSATYARYRLTNTSDQPRTGRLYLVIRPLQINPVWQHGGMSPIQSLRITESPLGDAVYVNDKEQFIAMTPVNAFTARAFEQGDIIEDIRRRNWEETRELHDAGEWLSGAMVFDYDLAPGAATSVVVAVPLHDSTVDIRAFASTGDGKTLPPAQAFDRHLETARKRWTDSLDKVDIRIPQQEAVDTMKAQIGYILVNQDGVSIQPGSRNYKRAWIRDGSLTSAALLRMGLTNEVRAYLDWYSERVQPDGWVPPILENTGEINKGFGWDNEYDSQGEYIYAIMEYYRFTGDQAFLEKHFDRIVGAMKYMQQLRERTLEPGYMSDLPAPERFRGIFPKSISHEGYSPPMHSYWDDFWGLKGWKDGRLAAEILGRRELAQWAEEQYQALRESTIQSIQATVQYKDINYVPGCAEKGDPDPTSTAIAFFPCGEGDLPPADLVQNTFDRYYTDLTNRFSEDWTGGFTPYEIRSVMAFVKLEQKERAKMLLDYMLSCRRPEAWNHLAEVVHSDPRLGVYIGDMPHTWVGSGYVNSLRGMLLYEDGERLVLFQGVPREWVENEGIRIANLPTHFGTLDLTAVMTGSKLTMNFTGNCAPPEGIELYWPRTDKPGTVRVNGQETTAFDDRRLVWDSLPDTVTVEW